MTEPTSPTTSPFLTWPTQLSEEARSRRQRTTATTLIRIAMAKKTKESSYVRCHPANPDARLSRATALSVPRSGSGHVAAPRIQVKDRTRPLAQDALWLSEKDLEPRPRSLSLPAVATASRSRQRRQEHEPVDLRIGRAWRRSRSHAAAYCLPNLDRSGRSTRRDRPRTHPGSVLDSDLMCCL